MQTWKVTADNPLFRLLGRMDREQDPIALDWTGSGLEVRHRGSALWAELEAPEAAPVFWMIVLADGRPVTRFPVEGGCRFYPLLVGMEAEQCRTVTLMKETQCMPAAPDATVFLRSLRVDGELLAPEPYRCRIEFVGDSLTSGEGALAPRDNEEWITPWFSARANYSWYACDALNAERRVLSQSGYGVCWDWEHTEKNNMADGYDRIAGVLYGEAAEKRGCRKAYDFSSWIPDLICIRLLTNDVNGMRVRDSLDRDRESVTRGAVDFILKVRRLNPTSRIVWILPGSASCPEIGEEAVRRAVEAGVDRLTCFALPDYGPEDFGARAHPNAAWNRRAGLLLADYLKTLL